LHVLSNLSMPLFIIEIEEKFRHKWQKKDKSSYFGIRPSEIETNAKPKCYMEIVFSLFIFLFNDANWNVWMLCPNINNAAMLTRRKITVSRVCHSMMQHLIWRLYNVHLVSYWSPSNIHSNTYNLHGVYLAFIVF